MRLWVIPAIMAAACLGGCLGQSPPRVRVIDASIVERTEEAVLVHFLLEASNEGDRALPMRRVSYELTLDGRSVFAAMRSAEATAPGVPTPVRTSEAITAEHARIRTQTFTLPVVVPRGDGGSLTGEASYRLRGTVEFVPPGVLAETLFDVGVSRPRARFRDSGVIRFDGEAGASGSSAEPVGQGA